MIQINPREIAAEALMEIMTADAYNTMTLRRLLRQNGAMSRQDRAFVTEVVNGTLRNLIYIDHVLNTFSKTKTEKMKPWLLAVLRTAVYQMYFMDVPDAAACNEAVKLASVRGYGSLKGFVNGVLRTAAKKKQEIPLPERGTAEYLSVVYSHPRCDDSGEYAENEYAGFEKETGAGRCACGRGQNLCGRTASDENGGFEPLGCLQRRAVPCAG